jgi:6-phosphogluconolactonase
MDLLLLGLGPDAHCASLFPGQDALGERERWVVGVDTPGMAPLVSRVTFTLPVLNAAREVMFLVSGEDKAEAVARAFDDAPDPDAPASLVNPEPGKLTILIDPPAAARLGDAR